jgi:erythromycin esterase
MEDHGATGTSDWKRYEITLPVDARAKNINFGMVLTGNGTAWFDDLAVDVDAQPYTDRTRFDFSFESPTPTGFRTGGESYQVMTDGAVAHGGQQSLRMQRTTNGDTSWQDIVAHLEAGRRGYRQKGATDGDIDWVVQNARIVLQSLQAQGDGASRDRSMADNVKWIADHNPKAKIVLWAHNGHVATSGGARARAGFESMGMALRNMFGRQMFIFGSAFNEGAFQAMSMPGLRQLRNYSVPPAPEGSLDATFAATHIPVFAIDLRGAPNWFKEPHRSREIGCCYPDNEPYAFLEDIVAADAFDAMLFVEKTNAAHKN